MLGEKLQWGAAEQGVLKVIDSNWVNLGGIVSVGVSGEAVTHRSFWFYRWPAHRILAPRGLEAKGQK